MQKSSAAVGGCHRLSPMGREKKKNCMWMTRHRGRGGNESDSMWMHGILVAVHPMRMDSTGQREGA